MAKIPVTAKKYEKSDRAADKRAGVKEGSKKDKMLDAKAGKPGKY
jgi:hypothetical protein